MRKVATIASPFLWLLLCWYGGADFLERNPVNAYLLLVGFFITVIVYICPAWDKNGS